MENAAKRDEGSCRGLRALLHAAALHRLWTLHRTLPKERPAPRRLSRCQALAHPAAALRILRRTVSADWREQDLPRVPGKVKLLRANVQQCTVGSNPTLSAIAN